MEEKNGGLVHATLRNGPLKQVKSCEQHDHVEKPT